MQLPRVSTDREQSEFPSPTSNQKNQGNKRKAIATVNNSYPLQSIALLAEEK